MWCTATRNLQRPELDWERFYPLYDDRDARLFQANPISGVADPPLSFVHSLTAQTHDGMERVILFSPENEIRIESLIESFKAGLSPFTRLIIHVHIAFTTNRCSDGAHPICSLRFSTSANNAQFVYPYSVTQSTYVSKWTQASDVWKAFNPALCRLPEMPKLLILRDCHFDPSPGDRWSFPVQYEKSQRVDSRDNFMRGVYDVGAVDYRGHFDWSYSAWFLSPSPGPLDMHIVKEEPM